MRSVGAIVFLLMGLFFLALSPAMAANEEAVNQGEYAVVLGKRLSDLCDIEPPICTGDDPLACVEGLRELDIEPVGGWQPDRVMNDPDIEDVTKAVIAAARAGKLGQCTPPRAIDIVAATSVDLGYSGRKVYITTFGVMGYYFPPQIPQVGGSGGGTVVSPNE